MKLLDEDEKPVATRGYKPLSASQVWPAASVYGL